MKNRIIIEKMLSYCEKVHEYSKELNYDEFVSQTMVLEACIFNLLQLGELVSKIDKVYIEDNEQIPWKAIRGLRHRLVHNYEGVNLELVWDIIKNDLPDLQASLKQLT